MNLKGFPFNGNLEFSILLKDPFPKIIIYIFGNGVPPINTSIIEEIIFAKV